MHLVLLRVYSVYKNEVKQIVLTCIKLGLLFEKMFLYLNTFFKYKEQVKSQQRNLVDA